MSVPEGLGAALAAATKRHLEVEIGCGGGHFLADYAERTADAVCLGIELKRQRCERTLAKLQRRSIRNAFVVNSRAEDILPWLPVGRVHAFHMYFPDPWPKARHRRRRLLRADIVDLMVLALSPGGQILFATDFLDYHVQARVLFAQHLQLELTDPVSAPGADRSTFALRLAGAGRIMRVACARKRSTPGSAHHRCDYEEDDR